MAAQAAGLYLPSKIRNNAETYKGILYDKS
jgi:hypothetical protein